MLTVPLHVELLHHVSHHVSRFVGREKSQSRFDVQDSLVGFGGSSPAVIGPPHQKEAVFHRIDVAVKMKYNFFIDEFL